MGEGKKFAAIFGLILPLWTPVLLGARAVCRITSAQLANKELALPAVVVDMLRFLPSALVYALVIGVPVVMGSSCFFIPGLVVASIASSAYPQAGPGG
jgi:branched-subunit amino acid transport protein